MAEHLQSIDLDTAPDLARLVDEVAATKQPRRLQRDGEDVVVLQPVKPIRRRARRKPFSLDDPLFDIVGIAHTEGLDDVAVNHDKYLADAYLNRHQ